MKKFCCLLTMFFLLLLSLTGFAFAVNTETYQSEDQTSPIQAISLSEDGIFLTINQQSDLAHELVLILINFTEETIGLPNPSSTAEEIQEKQLELGIDYQTVSQQLDLSGNPNAYQVIGQLESLTPGIYTKVNPEGQLVFLISQAELLDQDQSILIKLFNKVLLQLDKVDEQTLSYQDYSLIRQ